LSKAVTDGSEANAAESECVASGYELAVLESEDELLALAGAAVCQLGSTIQGAPMSIASSPALTSSNPNYDSNKACSFFKGDGIAYSVYSQDGGEGCLADESVDSSQMPYVVCKNSGACCEHLQHVKINSHGHVSHYDVRRVRRVLQGSNHTQRHRVGHFGYSSHAILRGNQAQLRMPNWRALEQTHSKRQYTSSMTQQIAIIILIVIR